MTRISMPKSIKIINKLNLENINETTKYFSSCESNNKIIVESINYFENGGEMIKFESLDALKKAMKN